MTDSEDEEMLRLAKEATPGPWEAYCSPGVYEVWGADKDTSNPVVHWSGFDATRHSRTVRKANAAFIAAANPSWVTAHIEAKRASERRVEELRQRVWQLWHQATLRDDRWAEGDTAAYQKVLDLIDSSGTDQPGGEAVRGSPREDRNLFVLLTDMIAEARATDADEPFDVTKWLKQARPDFYAFLAAPVKAEPEGWSDETVERMARAQRDYRCRKGGGGSPRLATWDECCEMDGWRDEQIAAMRAALIAAAGDG